MRPQVVIHLTMGRAWLLQSCTHRHWDTFEAVDYSFHDLMPVDRSGVEEMIFCCKTVVLGRDFRPILPIVPRGDHANIVCATICLFRLWLHCQVHVLTENMRLRNVTSKDVVSFIVWLLKLGKVRVSTCKLSNDEENGTWIIIPDKHLISHSATSIDCHRTHISGYSR